MVPKSKSNRLAANRGKALRSSWTGSGGLDCDEPQALHNAAFVELDWLTLNSLNIRFKCDFVEPDTEVKNDHVNRIGAGVDCRQFRRGI